VKVDEDIAQERTFEVAAYFYFIDLSKSQIEVALIHYATTKKN